MRLTSGQRSKMEPAFCYYAQKTYKKAEGKYKKSTNDKEVKDRQ
jgi:hypothetical protein